MITTRVYLYDSSQAENGYRGQDFSKNVLQGVQETENITEEMDTAEITLCGLSFSEEFAPETKFIIDTVSISEFGKDVVTRHWVVSRDITSQPILSDNSYFDHHISLIEPSVVAQKRLVDNIAATYKLKDVSLVERPAYPETTAKMTIARKIYTPDVNFGKQTSVGALQDTITTSWAKNFSLEGDVQLLDVEGNAYTTIYNNIENFKTPDGTYKAKFNLPKIKIYGGVENSTIYATIGYASIDYKIEELPLNLDTPTNIYTGSIISNSDLSRNNYSPLEEKYQSEWLPEESIYSEDSYLNTFYIGVKKYTDINASTPVYQTKEIPILPNKQYKITISLHQFNDNYGGESATTRYFKTKLDTPVYYAKAVQKRTMNTITSTTASYNQMTTAQCSSNCSFVFWDADTKEIVYSQSTPYSALALLQKAIVNSSLYEKKDGVYIADVNNSDLPFYIDEKYVNDLSSAQIIENFYNQKNLWEIMVEVGHYIHAIPELKFGDNDKFLITFNELGRTDQKIDNATKVSIYNSRSVEDYISATSSYVSNMVQLGGYIEEMVYPKTTDDTLLVSNDTAEIIVSKPIIELLSIKVISNINQKIGDLELSAGQTADLTNFIYEENVYKTLSIDYDVEPNRGIAMYYSLGKNIITGGQFQLPQANTTIYSDYTIKKIIYCAFNNGYPVIAGAGTVGYWKDLIVSNFSFYVKYRTKDSVRQNHIRPDLRKYLLNSQYDRFPEHNQFNNQTDVVVDSIKFGNNVYGKLIKTGNNSYTINEWNTDNSKLKHKGELYKINNELYYVSKATHTYYSTCITSEVVYSKDYNELSAVIGIPSEPRFYEISEQSLIWRELAINDILLLTDDYDLLTDEYGLPIKSFVANFDHLLKLILSTGTDFAKYAITVYKGDKDIGAYDQTVGEPNLYKEVINPINAYSSENTLTYEWDMIDNYSAGDKVIAVDPNETEADINKRAYNSLRAVGYTDIYGKSALLDFYILGDIKQDLTTAQIKALPECPINTKQVGTDEDTRKFVGKYDILATNVKLYDTNFNGRGIGLLKDCREAMSINFNLQLATNSDTFVVSPYVFLPNKKTVKVVLLSEEVNKLSNGYINRSIIITPIDVNGNTMSPFFDLGLITTQTASSWDSNRRIVENFGVNLSDIFKNVSEQHFVANGDYERVKSIAILCNVNLNPGEEEQQGQEDEDISSSLYRWQFIIARNIPESFTKKKATSNIYFGSPNKNKLFKNRQ